MGPRKGKTRGGVRKYSTIKERENSFNSRVKNGIVLKWPHDQTYQPEEMASFGFYYDPTYQYHDCVTCYYCKKKEYSWPIPREKIMMNDGMQVQPPILRHAHNSPDCINARILCARFECEHSKDFHWENDAQFKDPSESSEIRRKTFIGWPYDKSTTRKVGRRETEQKKSGLPTSVELADNGFYYISYDKGDDAVTCLYCGVSLEGWEKGDNVAEEHRKRNPDCYVFHYQDILKRIANESASENSTQNSEHSGSLYRLAVAEAETEKELARKPKQIEYPRGKEKSKEKALEQPELNEISDLVTDIDVDVDAEANGPSDNELKSPSMHKDTSPLKPAPNTNNNSLKVDEHGLTYEEIPDEGYLDDIDVQNSTPEKSVEIPASSLNELSDFFIEPSVSGPSTFFNKSRPSTRGGNKSGARTENGKGNQLSVPTQKIPEVNELEQATELDPNDVLLPEESANDIMDNGDFGMDFNNDNFNTPLPNDEKQKDTHRKIAEEPSKALTLVKKDSEVPQDRVALPAETKEELVNAIREEVRQEILKQMATINMTAKQLLFMDSEELAVKKKSKRGRKKRKHHHHHHRKGSVSQKEQSKEAIEQKEDEDMTVNDEMAKEVDNKIHNDSDKNIRMENEKKDHKVDGSMNDSVNGNVRKQVKTEKSENLPGDTEIASETSLISLDSVKKSVKQEPSLKRKTMQFIKKRSKRRRQNIDFDTVPADDLLISGGADHSRLKKMLSSHLSRVRNKGVHQGGSSVLLGNYKSENSDEEKEEKEYDEERKEEEEEEEKKETAIKKEIKDNIESDENSWDLTDNTISSKKQIIREETDAHVNNTVISLGKASEGVEGSDDDIILDNEIPSAEQDETKEENTEILELENANSQSTPYSDRVNKQSTSFEAKKLEEQLKLEMSKSGEDPTGTELDKQKEIVTWDHIKVSDPKKYYQDLQEASKILKSLLKSKYQVLSEDMDGQLTGFIAEMPAEELQMSIRDWMEHRAEQAAEYVRQKVHIMRKELHANTLKAVNYLEKLPCRSEIQTDTGEGEVIL